MPEPTEHRGTCPVCGYRVAIRKSRQMGNPKRICAVHHLWIGEDRKRCDGSLDTCKEDLVMRRQDA